MLYSSGLPETYWSAALSHANYQHNRRVHKDLERTPFEAWTGLKPDLTRLKLFSSRLCVKQTSHRRAKLGHHDLRGIFLGHAATDQNICYIDLDSGTIKLLHHAVLDEAWYSCTTQRHPAAQFLYDLGLVNETDPTSSLTQQLL